MVVWVSLTDFGGLSLSFSNPFQEKPASVSLCFCYRTLHFFVMLFLMQA